GIISDDLAAMSYGAPANPQHLDAVARGFARAYRDHHEEFKAVLLGARAYRGALLVGAWTRLSPNFLHFAEVARALVAADHALTGARRQHIIRESLAGREIGLSMDRRNVASQVGSGRWNLRSLPYRERWQLARAGLFL